MVLTAGTRLGPYEIQTLLGAGGMGEVYLARDTGLNRDVAVKVLPPSFARDAERMARFHREAQVLAALNHPNIAAIYGLGESDETRFLVLEYVPGDTLRGPVRAEEAVSIALQIADALEAAHEKGIVHRDLKPANIKITPQGRVKVLDFGLAKALNEDTTGSADTLTAGATRAGAVLGTAGYMSPEQARGKPLDKRTDIWAFGCVLYELLTGRQAFGRETASDSMVAILDRDADWTALPDATPPHVRRLLRYCLQKDTALRLRDAGDARLELQEPFSTAAPKPTRFGGGLWTLVAALLLGLALGSSLLVWRPPQRGYWRLAASGPKQVLRHAGPVFDAGLSPDGKQFAYVYQSELYLQTIGGGEPRRLTADGLRKSWPRFSSEGNRLIFEIVRAENRQALYVLDLPAGTPRLLVDDAVKGIWSPDGSKLAFIRPGLREAFVADAEGRQPHSVGSVRRWVLSGPSWSPDGGSLCLVDQGKVFLVSADGSSRKQVPGPEKVLAAQFTPDGEYLLVTKATGTRTHQIYQVRPSGGVLIPFVVGPHDVASLTFSRDGKSMLGIAGSGGTNLALFEPAEKEAEGGFQQVTFTGDVDWGLTLSPDEKRIAFLRFRGASNDDIWIVNVDGSDPRQLTTGTYRPGDLAWSPDGRTIASSGSDHQLWTIRLDEGNSRSFPTVAGDKSNPSYSADGKSLIFELTRSGKTDLWLAPAAGGHGSALTEDGVSMEPRAAPSGTLVAFFRQTPAKTHELAILNTLNRQVRVVATAETLAKSGKLDLRPPRWSRDGQFLFISVSSGLLRVRSAGGALERFSFPTGGPFEVLSDRRILTYRSSGTVEPWFYDDVQ